VSSAIVGSVSQHSVDPRPLRELLDVSPIAQLRAGRLGRRLTQLFLGLTLFALSMALTIRSGLGMLPWDVFHYGAAHHLPLSLGATVVATGVAVLLAWIPLRQRPGVGTVANAVWVGVVVDPALRVLPSADSLAWQLAFLLGGVTLNGLATAMYIGSQLGPGPRDGLMTGLARRSGRSIRLVRTGIEVTVVALGWALGGVVGIGTLLYALAIGPLTQAFLPAVTVALPRPPEQHVAARRSSAVTAGSGARRAAATPGRAATGTAPPRPRR
jgi:uncharacterized membrane protein YczE